MGARHSNHDPQNGQHDVAIRDSPWWYGAGPADFSAPTESEAHVQNGGGGESKRLRVLGRRYAGTGATVVSL